MLTYSLLQLSARSRYSAAPADGVAFGKLLPLSLFRLLTSSLYFSPSGPHSSPLLLRDARSMEIDRAAVVGSIDADAKKYIGRKVDNGEM
jgi:hypothetical protein